MFRGTSPRDRLRVHEPSGGVTESCVALPAGPPQPNARCLAPETPPPPHTPPPPPHPHTHCPPTRPPHPHTPPPPPPPKRSARKPPHSAVRKPLTPPPPPLHTPSPQVCAGALGLPVGWAGLIAGVCASPVELVLSVLFLATPRSPPSSSQNLIRAHSGDLMRVMTRRASDRDGLSIPSPGSVSGTVVNPLRGPSMRLPSGGGLVLLDAGPPGSCASPLPKAPFNTSAPLDGGGGPPPPPRLAPTHSPFPPSKKWGQIFLPGFRPIHNFSGAFGASVTCCSAFTCLSSTVPVPGGSKGGNGRAPFGGGSRRGCGWGGPQYANYWAPLTRKRHTMPHSAQPQHTKYWAPRTRKRHQQEHRLQRPTESSDPTQHAKGRTGDCPGPRTGTTTRRNVTQPPPPPPRVVLSF